MRQPGSIFHNLPPRDDDAARNLRDLERQVRMQGSAQSGQAMQVGAQGILVNNGGSLNINDGGAAFVNGLELSAVHVEAAFGNSTGALAVTTSFATIATATVNVPAGYTQAVILATAQAQADCSVASGDYFFLQLRAAASSPGAAGSPTWNTTGGIACQSTSGTLYGYVAFPQQYTTLSTTMTGLNGGTISAQCQISSQISAWTASTSTGGTVTLLAIFLP